MKNIREKELFEKFNAEKILSNEREYIKIPARNSYSFRIHFKTLFPEKDLVLIYFTKEFEVWRIESSK